MKKCLSVMLCAVLLLMVTLSLASCGGDDNSKGDADKKDAYYYSDLISVQISPAKDDATKDALKEKFGISDLSNGAEVLAAIKADTEFMSQYTDTWFLFTDATDTITYFCDGIENDYALSKTDDTTGSIARSAQWLEEEDIRFTYTISDDGNTMTLVRYSSDMGNGDWIMTFEYKKK